MNSRSHPHRRRIHEHFLARSARLIQCDGVPRHGRGVEEEKWTRINEVSSEEDFNKPRSSSVSKDQNLDVRGEDFPRKTVFLAKLSFKVCHVRVTVDLPTFCVVTIFSVESKELELELEQQKSRHPKKNYQRIWKIHTEKIR